MCPPDISRTIELGENGLLVDWELPTGTDLSEPVTIVSFSHPPGFFFTVGSTEVIYTLTDAASNENSCSFVVVVSTSE